MAKPLFLPITPILLLACLCRSHGLRFVYMYQQYMRRRRRKRHHCGFAGDIQALRAHVAELLILPKNLKRKDFERFNQDCIGAIDGVHVPVVLSVCKQHTYKGRKRELTINCMCACDFDMKFAVACAGWEGSAHETRIFLNCLNNESDNFPKSPLVKIDTDVLDEHSPHQSSPPQVRLQRIRRAPTCGIGGHKIGHKDSSMHDDELEDDVWIMSRSLLHRPNITRGLINAKLVLQTHTDEVWFLEFSHNWKCLVHHQKINQQLYGRGTILDSGGSQASFLMQAFIFTKRSFLNMSMGLWILLA